MEGFDNMSVILDAGPTELLSVEPVEAREAPQLEPEAPQWEIEAMGPMHLEPDTAEPAIVEPAEPTEKASLRPVSTGMNLENWAR